MIRAPKRVDQLVKPPVEGKVYLVPTVRGEWLNDHGIGDWPVVGVRHKDTDLGSNISHYHIDHRFVPEASFKADTNTVVAESCDNPIHYAPWKCLQNNVRLHMARFPDVPYADFAARWRGVQCAGSRKTGWICPHRQTYLGSLIPLDGIITCPSHTLRIDLRTGKVV